MKSASSSSPIDGKEWFSHFSNLHSEKLEPGTLIEINNQPPCDILNQPFTKNELLKKISKLRNCKAHGYDRINNEMIKNSPNCLLDLILKYINLCLDKSMISKSLCYDIINPILMVLKVNPGITEVYASLLQFLNSSHHSFVSAYRLK